MIMNMRMFIGISTMNTKSPKAIQREQKVWQSSSCVLARLSGLRGLVLASTLLLLLSSSLPLVLGRDEAWATQTWKTFSAHRFCRAVVGRTHEW